MTKPRPRLTPYSQRRVDTGAVKGSGTDVCALCRKDKEPERVNFMKCLKCDRPPGTRKPFSGGPKTTRRTRLYRG